MASEKSAKNLLAEPVAYLVLCSSFRASPDGQDAEGHEWLEEAGCDTPGAFPVFRAPQFTPETLNIEESAKVMERCLAMEAALQHCEQMLMKYSIDRVDHEAIEDEALAIIRAALAKATS